MSAILSIKRGRYTRHDKWTFLAAATSFDDGHRVRTVRGQKDGQSALNAAIEVTNRAKKISFIAPVKAAFGTVGILLALIRDSMVNEPDCVELGLFCANVCRALDQGTNGKKPDELSRSVYDAINLLTSTVEGIQKKLVKWGKRSAVSRRLHAKSDKEAISTWRPDLDEVLQVFHKELKPYTDVILSIIPRHVSTTPASVSDISRKGPENTHSQDWPTHASVPGESRHPLPGNTHGSVIDVRHEAIKTHAIVSELRYNAADTNVIVPDTYRTIVKGQEENGGKNRPIQTSTPGEAPPPHQGSLGATGSSQKLSVSWKISDQSRLSAVFDPLQPGTAVFQRKQTLVVENTTWVLQWSGRLLFCTGSTSSRRQGLRLFVPSKFFEEPGVVEEIEFCRAVLSRIKEEMDSPITLYSDGTGQHNLAWLYRRFIFFRRILRAAVNRG